MKKCFSVVLTAIILCGIVFAGAIPAYAMEFEALESRQLVANQQQASPPRWKLLPYWMQWILRYLCFGWLWMRNDDIVTVEPDIYDIIIVAGQSNAAGRGGGTKEPSFKQDDTIQMMPQNSNKIIPAAERIHKKQPVGNFWLTFARQYIDKGKLGAGRKLLILQAAVDNTGFSDNRWGLNDDLYLNLLNMVDTALALNSKNKLVALLWHQGERDVSLGADQATHAANLSALVKNLRNRYSAPKLPFIAGDFVQQWKRDREEACEPIVAAIRAACEEAGKAAFVETDGLNSNDEEIQNGDKIHFSRAALETMGQRYFEKFLALL